MGARRLAESAVLTIQDYIRANISQALDDTIADRASANDWPQTLSYEPPASYFFYEKAAAYEAPAVFTIITGIDFKKDERRANHVNALASVDVEIVVEDKDAEILTLRTWRYQDAIHELLDQTNLTTTDNKVKLSIEVVRARFSGVHSNVTERNSQTMFRAAALLECNVNIWQNF